MIFWHVILTYRGILRFVVMLFMILSATVTSAWFTDNSDTSLTMSCQGYLSECLQSRPENMKARVMIYENAVLSQDLYLRDISLSGIPDQSFYQSRKNTTDQVFHPPSIESKQDYFYITPASDHSVPESDHEHTGFPTISAINTPPKKIILIDANNQSSLDSVIIDTETVEIQADNRDTLTDLSKKILLKYQRQPITRQHGGTSSKPASSAQSSGNSEASSSQDYGRPMTAWSMNPNRMRGDGDGKQPPDNRRDRIHTGHYVESPNIKGRQSKILHSSHSRHSDTPPSGHQSKQSKRATPKPIRWSKIYVESNTQSGHQRKIVSGHMRQPVIPETPELHDLRHELGQIEAENNTEISNTNSQKNIVRNTNEKR